MIAIDTNILVYAHRTESPWNEAAYAAVERLWRGSSIWMIPWPCLHEFYVVATHPKVHRPPTPTDTALQQIEFWLQSRSLVLGSEGEAYWPLIRRVLTDSRVVGPMAYDARIAAVCLQYDVEALWTADRDFGRFPTLRCQNPLIRQ